MCAAWYIRAFRVTRVTREVDVVTPHFQGRKVVTEIGRQVQVNSDFVVLQSNQWQGQSWVSVKEKDHVRSVVNAVCAFVN